jgi:long-subunit acyl-CoA synthetase (AMP-forming)
VVPIDAKLGVNEILNILHESESVAIIYSEAFQPMLSERRASLKNLKYYINMDRPAEAEGILSMMELIAQSPGHTADNLPRIAPEELAEIIYRAFGSQA